MAQERGRGPGTEIAALIRGTLVLGVVVLVAAGLVRTCSFAPGAPEIDRSTLPRVDVAARLTTESAAVRFPLRVPGVPAGWIAQSQDTVVVGPSTDPAAPRAVRVGWVTPDDRFVRLVQTDADAGAAVLSERGDPAARGTVDVGGRPWAVYGGVRGEALWVGDLGEARLLVTGSATPEELSALAGASSAAPPLPG